MQHLSGQKNIAQEDIFSQCLLSSDEIPQDTTFSIYMPPPGVDYDDLYKLNAKLLSIRQIQYAEKYVRAYIKLNGPLKEGKKFSKKLLGPDYGFSIFAISRDALVDNLQESSIDLYGIYYGEKKGKEKGSGANAVVKHVQYLKTGQWILGKFIKLGDLQQEGYLYHHKEKTILKKKTLTYGAQPSKLLRTDTSVKDEKSSFYDLRKLNSEEEQFLQNLPNFKKPSIDTLRTQSQYLRFKNIEFIMPITDEAAILDHFKKLIGQVIIKNKKEEKCVLLIPSEGDDTLEFYLDNQKRIHLKDALKIAINLLESYHELLTLGFIHRDLKPANIIVHVIRNYLIRFVDMGSGVIIKTNKDMNNFYHPVYKEDKIHGTPCYVSKEIVTAMFNDPANMLQVAKSLGSMNPQMVVELILNNGKEDFGFLLRFATVLVSDIKNRKSMSKIELFRKTHSRIVNYILPVMKLNSPPLVELSSRATELLAVAVVYTIQKDKDLAEMQFFVWGGKKLESMHEAFKIALHYWFANLPNPIFKELSLQSLQPPDREIISYDEKTEMYPIGKILEEVFLKTAKTNHTFVRNLVFEQIYNCKHPQTQKRPTFFEAIQRFKELLNCYFILNPKIPKFFEKSIKIDGYINIQKYQELLKQNSQLDYLSLKKFNEIVLISDTMLPLYQFAEIKFRFEMERIPISNQIIICSNHYPSFHPHTIELLPVGHGPDLKKMKRRSTNDNTRNRISSGTMRILHKLDPSKRKTEEEVYPIRHSSLSKTTRITPVFYPIHPQGPLDHKSSKLENSERTLEVPKEKKKHFHGLKKVSSNFFRPLPRKETHEYKDPELNISPIISFNELKPSESTLKLNSQTNKNMMFTSKKSSKRWKYRSANPQKNPKDREDQPPEALTSRNKRKKSITKN